MSTDAQKKASAKYMKNARMVISVNLSRENDADLVEIMEKTDNRQALIKEALRAYLKKPEKQEVKRITRF